MSARKLGGGRVLGSGRSLSPAHPPRNSSLLSPSASTVSVSSSASTQPSTDPQDISSRISLDQSDGGNAAAAAADSRLACPICNEDMVTLLQLNRHLDDIHKNLEEGKQAEAKDWFKTQMVKAKRFQPLAVLNQKFKGLDVFDSENEPPPSPSPKPTTTTGPSPAASQPIQQDPDDVVTKTHWQRHVSDLSVVLLVHLGSIQSRNTYCGGISGEAKPLTRPLSQVMLLLKWMLTLNFRRDQAMLAPSQHVGRGSLPPMVASIAENAGNCSATSTRCIK